MRAKSTKREIYWQGRWWKIIRLAEWRSEHKRLKDEEAGSVHTEDAEIVFRPKNRDYDILTLLHEAIHVVYPDLEESEVKRGEKEIKIFLEEMGVNLSPMLRGFD